MMDNESLIRLRERRHILLREKRLGNADAGDLETLSSIENEINRIQAPVIALEAERSADLIRRLGVFAKEGLA